MMGDQVSLNVLIVEDQFIEADDLRSIVEKAGHQVCGIAKSVADALLMMESNVPDIVLLDIFLFGPVSGIDLAKVLSDRRIPFIYISANSDSVTFNTAKATRPDGFLIKPFREKDVVVALDIAIYRHQSAVAGMQPVMVDDNKTLSYDSVRSNDAFNHIKGKSKKLINVLLQAEQVAPRDTTVLICGETGVGKEGLALAIHKLSRRKNKVFVKINCGAIPAGLIESELFGHEKGSFTGAIDKRIGKFEQAQGGTILLDEIGELPIETQAKLLRVIQEKELERVGGRTTIRLDIRIIAATNRNLYDEVAIGRFRLDLYYRINVFTITLPPLRERREDICLLADFFLKKFTGFPENAMKHLSKKAIESLESHNWPGNIRELENVVERHVILASDAIIESIDFQQPIQDLLLPVSEVPDLGRYSIEASKILNALTQSNGKVSGKGGAAEILDIPAPRLISKMRKLGIKWRFMPENL